MNEREMDRIADAVLYEGYLLYPYRPSVKNVHRWTFGTLYPQAHSEALNGLPPHQMRTEVLLSAPQGASLRAKVRFLQVESRTVGRSPDSGGFAPEASEFPPVESVQVSGVLHFAWQEGLERTFTLEPQSLDEVTVRPHRRTFRCSPARRRELLRDPQGRVVGDVVRTTAELCAELELSAQPLGGGVHRVTLTTSNQTGMAAAADAREAEHCVFAGTHVLLQAEGGRFLSLSDPPAAWSNAAAACRNVGNWPVLIGDTGSNSHVLGAPIILPDYPKVAPESPGDLYDSTEVDEILSLRIQTLSPAEKEAMARLDPRSRALLNRTEALARREMASLHGTWRPPKESSDER